MHDTRAARARAALFGIVLSVSPVALAAQHDHAGHHGAPVDCRTLAAPPWSGLSAADRATIERLQRTALALRETDAATRAGFTPQFGDIPTMGVHWVNRDRMQDAVQADAPDHLLFTRIDGRDSLVGVAYAFRGPTNATLPTLYDSPLATWHDHAALGGGDGNTLHMLHVWFVPSPYGAFAGNNFFLPLMVAGRALPNACWIQTDAEVERFELIASLVDALHRFSDLARVEDGHATGRKRVGATGARSTLATDLGALAERLTPHFAALDAAARAVDRVAWDRAADDALAALRPAERRLVETMRDRVKGIQSSTGGQRRGSR